MKIIVWVFIVVFLHTAIGAKAGDGLPLWTNRCKTEGMPQSIAVDCNSAVLVGGNDLVVKYSNSGVPLWTNRHEPLGGVSDQLLVTDSLGNVIVTGIGAGEGTGDDFATIKYSSAGLPLWTNRYAGDSYGYDWPRALTADGNGNVFVTGFSDDGAFTEDFLTIGYSSSGVPLWTNRFGGPNSGVDQPTGIAVDGNGNVFVTGFSRWFQFRSYFTTIKYSGAGVPLWTNRYGYGPDDAARGNAIAIDRDGNILVTGSSYDLGTDYVTIKYSNDGISLWTNRYNGSGNFNDEGLAVGTDGNGQVFVTGISVNDHGGMDYVTLAYSSSGSPLWTNYYGEPFDGGRPAVLVVDESGNVIVSGASAKTSGSYFDFLTIKYSNAGIPLWTNRYEGADGFDDHSVDAAVDQLGNVFVTGPSLVGHTQGNYEYVTIKYSAGEPPIAWLNFSIANQQLMLSWTNAGFSLETASGVDAPFTTIPDATNPYTNEISGPQRFFRLKAN